jgi:hypothetical protein
MTTALMPEPRQRYYNNNGSVAAGCLLYTYAAGTSTPKATYADSAGTTPHANPIVLDSKGEALVYWNGSYKVDLKTSAGVQVTGYPVDNYAYSATATDTLRTDLAASTGAGLVGAQSLGVGAAATTVQAALRRYFIDADAYISPSYSAAENNAGWTALKTYATSLLPLGSHVMVSAGTYAFNAEMPLIAEVIVTPLPV